MPKPLISPQEDAIISAGLDHPDPVVHPIRKTERKAPAKAAKPTKAAVPNSAPFPLLETCSAARMFLVRFPPDQFERIQEAVKKYPGRVSLNLWLTSAIQHVLDTMDGDGKDD